MILYDSTKIGVHPDIRREPANQSYGLLFDVPGFRLLKITGCERGRNIKNNDRKDLERIDKKGNNIKDKRIWKCRFVQTKH